MKLPQIVGKNKLRDFRICSLYIQGKTPEEIASDRTLGLGVRRVQKILNANAGFVNPKIAWPKSKRIHILQRVAVAAGDQLSEKKDILNVLEQLRKEIEGDRPQLEQTFITNVNYAWQDEDHNNPLLSAEVSNGHTQLEESISSSGDRKTGRENVNGGQRAHKALD